MSTPYDANALNFVRRSLAERRHSRQIQDDANGAAEEPSRTAFTSRPASGQPPRAPSAQAGRSPTLKRDGDVSPRKDDVPQMEDEEVRAHWAWLAATSSANASSSPLQPPQPQRLLSPSDAPRRISYYAGFLPDALDRGELPSALRTTTRASVDLSGVVPLLSAGDREGESVWGGMTASSVTRGSGHAAAGRRRRATLSATFADTASGRSHSGTRTQSVTFDETLAEAMMSTSQRMKGHQQEQQQRRRSSATFSEKSGDSDDGDERRGTTYSGRPLSGDEGRRSLTWAGGALPLLSDTTAPVGRSRRASNSTAPRDCTGSSSSCGDPRPRLLGSSVREVRSVGDNPRDGSGGDAQLSHHQLTEAFYGSYKGGKMARDAYLYFVSQQQQQQSTAQGGKPTAAPPGPSATRQRGSRSTGGGSAASPVSKRQGSQRQRGSTLQPAARRASTDQPTPTPMPLLSSAALTERRTSPPSPTKTTTAASAPPQNSNDERKQSTPSLFGRTGSLVSSVDQRPRTPSLPRPQSGVQRRVERGKEDGAAVAATAVVPTAPAASADDTKKRLEELWRRSERIFQQRQQGD